MAKSNGIKSLKQAAKLLNKHSPDGESLAYINPEEAKLLRSHGGSGIMTVAGVPTYGLDFWNWNWLAVFVRQNYLQLMFGVIIARSALSVRGYQKIGCPSVRPSGK